MATPDWREAPAPHLGAETWVEREVFAMGTRLRIRLAAPDRAAGFRVIEQVLAAVRRREEQLSTWRRDTELARFNAAPVGEPFPLSADLFLLLSETEGWITATDRAFDPTVGALVDAWAMRRGGRRPSAAELAAALAGTGPAAVRLLPAGRAAVRTHPAAWIDSGAFGKGAALRDARRLLDSLGVERAFLDFGGQVLALGSVVEGTGWPVGVAQPDRRAHAAVVLALTNRSAATSGQAERFVEVDGTRLGHVLDPRSGLPVPAWGSVTVVAEDPLVADILSTALFVMGSDAGRRWVDAHPDVAALFLTVVGDRVATWCSDPMVAWVASSAHPIGEGAIGCS